jgi:hypothetical protein
MPEIARKCVPFTPFEGELARATVAIVSSAGVHRRDQPGFNIADDLGDLTFRLIDGDINTADLMVTHHHYDHSDADADINVVFPIDALRELAQEGFIGAVASEHVRAQPSPGDKPECLTSDGSPNLDVPNIAANCPDMFAWMTFLEVNSPAPENPDYVTWQLWTTDRLTFPSRPEPAACDAQDPPPDACPIWPVSRTEASSWPCFIRMSSR